MKITKRQLRKIIREKLDRNTLNENAYDNSKYELADMTSEMDAVDEVLSDLVNALAPQDIIDEVEMAIEYGENLETILSMVPTTLKDRAAG